MYLFIEADEDHVAEQHGRWTIKEDLRAYEKHFKLEYDSDGLYQQGYKLEKQVMFRRCLSKQWL